MTESPQRPRPRAVRLGEPGASIFAGDPAQVAPDVVIEPQADAFLHEPVDAAGADPEAAVELAQQNGVARSGWLSAGSLFWSALGGLVSLGLGLWVDSLIEGLFARALALGWLAVALLVIAVAALGAILWREIGAVFRQRHIAGLHLALAEAWRDDAREAARRHVRDLVALYAQRPETAAARRRVLDLTNEIVDARDLINIAERELMHPLDEQAQREIANAAKRVSVVTAISPRALLDVLFVAAQAVRIVRSIAEIYGGRPGLLGFIRLARSVGSHLAITGGMAVGDSLIQQIVGHGIAARLSARLGEGVLNGLLTARVGLSAMAVCRPAPFHAETQPGVKDVAPFLFGDRKD